MADKKSIMSRILDNAPVIGTARENKRLREAIQHQKFYDAFSSGSNYMNFGDSGGGVSSLFMETLQAGYSGKNYNQDPRRMLETYKAMTYTFPVFMAAINIRNKALGCPRLVSDDEGMQKDLDYLTENLPIRNWKNPYKVQKGLERLKDRLYIAALTKGTAFCQMLRDESGNPVATELYRSEWFDVCKDINFVTQFYFNSVTGRIDIKSDGDFQIYSQTVREWDWGVPIGYGADYFAWAALRMIESRLSFEGRIGNPSVFFLMSGDPTNSVTGTIDDRVLKLIKDKVSNIKQAVNAGMKHTNNTGRPFDLFDYVPANAKLESFTFGQGVSGSSSVPEIIAYFANQMIYNTDVPDFLLQNAGAAGMGSDRYRHQNSQFQSLIKGDRSGVEPHLLKPAVDWLMFNKTSPRVIKSLKIEWDAPNTNDLKLEAETDLTNAQAFGQQLMNIDTIVNNTGGGKSVLLADYLEKLDLDEAIINELNPVDISANDLPA